MGKCCEVMGKQGELVGKRSCLLSQWGEDSLCLPGKARRSRGKVSWFAYY